MKTRRTDEYWMNKALALAQRGMGCTRPNPPVGALLVRDTRMVGAGYHQRAGAPHAEAIAIEDAGRRARNATLYVTLEPCCTTGKTPPCVKAILQAGIKRVVVATRDPNPRHNGKGLTLLRKAGVDVIEGVCAQQADILITPFAHWLKTGRPYLILKMAMTFDGKTADGQGLSRWITGPRARHIVHAWRRHTDAVIVGAGTVRADNPTLLPAPDNGRRPWRVIADAKGIADLKARVLNDHAARQTIMATTAHCPTARQKAWAKNGAQVWVLPSDTNGVSLRAMLNMLGRQGALMALCEGGARLAASLIQAGLVNEYRFFIAPLIIGGKRAPGVVNGTGLALSNAEKLIFTGYRRIEHDILITALPAAGNKKCSRD